MPHVWPVALSVDTGIVTLLPGDLDRSSPLRFLEFQVVRDRTGQLVPRVVYQPRASTLTHYLWPREADLAPARARLGEGIGFNQAVDFAASTVELGDRGLTVHVDVTDPDGHRLVYRMRNPRPWTGVDFAAPPGAAMTDPHAFFVPYILDFDLVPADTPYEASFAGAPLRHSRAPFLRRGRPVLTLKGGTGSAVVEFLPESGDPLTDDAPGVHCDPDGGLRGYVTGDACCPVTLRFDPPLPPADRIVHDDVAWHLDVRGRRIAAGRLRAERDTAGLAVKVRVTHGWVGVSGDRTLAAVVQVFRFLRRWPLAYSWDGRFDTEGGRARLTGRWTNRKVKSAGHQRQLMNELRDHRLAVGRSAGGAAFRVTRRGRRPPCVRRCR